MIITEKDIGKDVVLLCESCGLETEGKITRIKDKGLPVVIETKSPKRTIFYATLNGEIIGTLLKLSIK